MNMNRKWSILEIIVALLLIIMVLVTFMGVIFRYVFNRPIIFNEELVRFLLINVILLASIINSRDNNQLSVDVFFNLIFTKYRTRRVATIIIDTIVVLAMAALTYYGVILVNISQKQHTTILKIPFPIIYSIIPFFAIATMFYHFKSIYNNLIK